MRGLIRITLFSLICFSYSAFLNAQPKIDSRILDAFQSGASETEVVITFYGNSAPSLLQINMLKQAGILNGFSFKSLPMVGAVVTPAQLNLLSNNSQIRSIYLNRELEYYNYESTALTGVDRLRSDPNITVKNNGMPVSGKGITVLVNDSGVDGTHDDIKFNTHLIQNAVGSTNPHAYSDLLPIIYLENIPNSDNNSGHGTHVSGIVGGTGAKSAGKYEGVAPGANLVGYGSGAVLFILDAVGGFDYGITNQFQYGIRVITNSWGTSGKFDPFDPVNIASKIAYDRNIVVLFAAGNSGPGEDTHNPYAIAPWVISVAAGDKYGGLADFSSRGVKGQTGTFEMDGVTWTYENRPIITAPGVDIISTRAIGPVSSLGADTDVNTIEPAYLPYYTTMSGTSMATPHAAGIVALMLEANKSLTPLQVKDILQKTATNMPGYESWEAGAGYINAYAAVDYVINNRSYSSLANYQLKFNSNVNQQSTREYFTINYYTDPALSPTGNSYLFNVKDGTSAIEVRVNVYGILGETGNSINLVVISPTGDEYSSGIPVAFTLYTDRSVSVLNPAAGTWKVELRGLRGTTDNPTSGVAVPEEVGGNVKFMTFMGYTGLNDISGNSAEDAIKLAVSERLVDGYPNGKYKPSSPLIRIDLAKYLMMGQGIRQYYPTNNVVSFGDVPDNQTLLVESVTNKGAAIRDQFQIYKGVMQPASTGTFSPTKTVDRLHLAYSLVQSLGLQKSADSLAGQPVKVYYYDQEITLDDDDKIPAEYKGYVQLAVNLKLINVYFFLTQGPYDLEPTLHASFKPAQTVTRGDFAVIITRTFDEWQKNDALGKSSAENNSQSAEIPFVYSLGQNYPNPFNPTTTIKYSLAKDGFVSLELYNILGEKVATLINEYQKANKYSVNFDASRLASGIYLYRLVTSDYVKTLKMSLVK